MPVHYALQCICISLYCPVRLLSVESTQHVLCNKCSQDGSFGVLFQFFVLSLFFNKKAPKRTEHIHTHSLYALSNLYKSSLSLLDLLSCTTNSILDNYVFRFHDNMLSRTLYWKLLISQFLLFTGFKLFKPQNFENMFFFSKEIETFKFDANYINFEKENMIIVYHNIASAHIFQQ